MTSLITNGCSNGSSNNNFEIPSHLLKKAAESALVSSFVDLNTKRISPLQGPSNGTHCHKVVIDLVAQKSPGESYDTSVFVKVIPRKLKTSSLDSNSIHLDKEAKVYEEFIRELFSYEKKRRWHSSFPSFLPKCYLTHPNEDNVMLFLENLNSSGFKNYEGNKCSLDFNHSLLSIESLSRLHASSYFLQRQLGPKAKGRLALMSKYPFLKSNSFPSSQYREMIELIYEKIILRIVDKENPSLAFKLQRKVVPSAIFDKMTSILEDEKYDNDDFYVICHGDVRINHLLFKYGQDNIKEPTECRLVDLKHMKLAPIASDLTVFFMTSTTWKLREEFEEKLLAFYCDMFEEQLKICYASIGQEIVDFDIEEFHRKLEDQYKRMLEYGFYAGIVMTLPLVFGGLPLNNDSLQRLSNEKDAFEKLVKDSLNNSELSQRVLGAVQQLIKCRIF